MTTPSNPYDGLIEEIANDVCRDVCELPDRTSPEDWPEACLVTSEELHIILTERLIEALSRLTRDVEECREGIVRCEIPPVGWWCSRIAGHEGPCAARPVNPARKLCEALYSRFDDEPDFLGIEAAQHIEIMGEAIQRIHRYALAAEGVGYDLILSVTDPIIALDQAQGRGR